MSGYWKKCNFCKKEIPYRSQYYVCSVSTCNRKSTNYAFCSVACWDGHLPIERHKRDAGAIEQISPSFEQPQEEDTGKTRTPQKGMVIAPSTAEPPVSADILVVASKVKKYIKDRSGMNTSTSTFSELTKRITALCDQAIENTSRDGRKTVMDRDVPRVIVP